MIGSDLRGSKVNDEPVLILVTATSSNSFAGSSRHTTRAVHSDGAPSTSTSRRGSTARTIAWSGRTSSGPHSETHAPSECPGEAVTVTVSPTVART